MKDFSFFPSEMKVQHSKATTSSVFPRRLSKPLYWQPGVNFLHEAQQCDTTVVGAAAAPLPFSRAKSAKIANPHRARNIWRRWENISASASENVSPRAKTWPAVCFIILQSYFLLIPTLLHYRQLLLRPEPRRDYSSAQSGRCPTTSGSVSSVIKKSLTFPCSVHLSAHITRRWNTEAERRRRRRRSGVSLG